MKAILLDFDGLVVDSVYECYIISLKAYNDVGGNLEDSKNVEKEFMKARVFVRKAEDYYPFLRAIEENKGIDFDKIGTDKIIKLREKYKEESRQFHDRFYAHRLALQKEDMGKWLKLFRPYPGIVEAVKELSKNFRIMIATAKDRNATMLLLKNIGIEIEEKYVITKEIFKDKASQIKFISEKYDIPFNKILFVEDILENLLSVRDLGIRLALVSWGYSTERQRKDAESMGIPIIKPGNNIAEQIINIFGEERARGI